MIQHPALPFVRVNADIAEVVLALMWKELPCRQTINTDKLWHLCQPAVLLVLDIA